MKTRFVALLITLMFVFSTVRADSPTEIAGATTIDVATAKTLFDKGVTFVDVRGSSYVFGHVPGAVHFEHYAWSSAEATLTKKINKDQEVVFYCGGPSCNRSSEACKAAVSWGFKKVHYFRDGYPGWEAAGYAVEK